MASFTFLVFWFSSIRDRVRQGHFRVSWMPGASIPVDFFTIALLVRRHQLLMKSLVLFLLLLIALPPLLLQYAFHISRPALRTGLQDNDSADTIVTQLASPSWLVLCDLFVSYFPLYYRTWEGVFIVHRRHILLRTSTIVLYLLSVVISNFSLH